METPGWALAGEETMGCCGIEHATTCVWAQRLSLLILSSLKSSAVAPGNCLCMPNASVKVRAQTGPVLCRRAVLIMLFQGEKASTPHLIGGTLRTLDVRQSIRPFNEVYSIWQNTIPLALLRPCHHREHLFDLRLCWRKDTREKR